MGFNKMQGVNFRNVSEFIDYLPDQERHLVLLLQDLIFETVPDITEKLSYNVPYYFRNRRLCFIWPASVPWGRVELNGVMLGICQGHLLSEHNYFELQGRRQVATRIYHQLTSDDRDWIRYYLTEAWEIDRQFKPVSDK